MVTSMRRILSLYRKISFLLRVSFKISLFFLYLEQLFQKMFMI